MFTFSLCPTTKLYIKNWFVKFAAFNYRFSFNNILFGPEMSSSCLIFSHSILQITFFFCCSYYYYYSFKYFICNWYHECLSVNSAHRTSKYLRIPWPAFPTGESSSLNISQLSNINRTSAIKSSRDLYLNFRKKGYKLKLFRIECFRFVSPHLHQILDAFLDRR